ncbi:MAG: hypothetical protein ACLFM1_07330 [Bacteroidales bacterium]
MKELKKISIRLLVLVLLLVLLNIGYKKLYYNNYKDINTEFVEILDKVSPSCKVLYVGESSNLTTRKDDTDKRWIHEFISACYPEIEFCDITKPASHAGTYYAFLRALPADHNIETVIVTLNLRSFNTVWIHSQLETNLQKNALMIQPYPPLVNRMMLSLKTYDEYSDEETTAMVMDDWENDPLPVPDDFPHKNVQKWDKWIATHGIKDSSGKKDPDKTILACHYVKGYAFQIDTLNNPRIKDFNKIVKLANKRNWNLVFNLMAENVDKANELLGNDLINIMDYNVDLLVDYYSRRGVTVVNNFRNVRNDQFINQKWTTEHYAEIGRKSVAKCVADSLKKFYPDQYKNRLKSGNIQFFNDYESEKSPFQGKANRQKKYAAAGKFSSMVSLDNKYSQTAVINNSKANYTSNSKIMVSAKLLAPTKNCSGLFVIEGRKNGKITDWRSFGIKETIESEERWYNFNKQITFDKKLQEADQVKLFFMAEEDTFYLDNFKIEVFTK